MSMPRRQGVWLVSAFVGFMLAAPSPAHGQGAAPAKGKTAPAGSPAAPEKGAAALPASVRRVLVTGRLPFFDPSEPMDADLDLEVRLYISPHGGRPLWREPRKVRVRRSEMRFWLGEKVALPPDVFTRTFRYVAFVFGEGPELTPRLPIESCVWVSGPAGYGKAAAPPAGGPRTWARAAKGLEVEASPRKGATWLQAAQTAVGAGARLPTVDEWLSAYEVGDKGGFRDLTGHYEWVQPFVFSHQSHLRAVLAYRGKPSGCSEEELSPSLNRFVYRLARKAPKEPGRSR